MLKARVLTALALLAGFLSVLFLLPSLAVAAALALVVGLGAWEWAGLMAAGRIGRLVFSAAVLISCLLAYELDALSWVPLWTLSAVFWLVVAPLWLWQRWSLAGSALIGYGVGWLLLVPTWAAMLALHGRSPWLLLSAMALVWVADTGAYFVGRAFGRHKLAPAISPGKTWEGVIGALVSVAIYGALVFSFGSAPSTVGLPLALSVTLFTAVSIVGDLFESLAKRQVGVKDSSGLLPGHGGILDRIDSQTSTLPLVALVVHWMKL